MKTAEEMVAAYGNMLYRAALSHTGNHEDAQDMVQETFIRWLEKRPAFESDEHEKAWLLRVAINLCRNYVSKKGNRGNAELLDIYPAADEEEQSLIQDVMALPDRYRDVIYLYYYEGYSTKEIADILGEKEATVRSHMLRARKLLKGRLEADYE